ncbi:hypothetical protein WR25_03969 [Diploscapter pachys]|uniref:Vacuolar protein sorting-associated protein 29 n=1 Tax=Diploscapter pachys TaxID=2018661 RepID=A0A2A2JKU6_9BILA|nr:hypothetical protein WR25_03969 [Diploscapter pachys]
MGLFLRRSSFLCSRIRRQLSNSRSENANVKEVSDRLRRFFIDKIKVSGPITVAEYMKTAISSSSVGYYGSFSEEQKVFGSQGDFVTAPEMSQMFGEMIAVWCFNELANTGHRGTWKLVECGPGTGQLTSDLLRSLNSFKESNFSVHLVETSSALIEEQEKNLCPSTSKDVPEIPGALKSNKTKTGIPIYWYNNVDDLPDGFSVFVANEFLDALPVHQFARSEDGIWREIYVGLNEQNQLAFTTSKGENLHTKGFISEAIRSDKSKKYFEYSPDALTFAHQVAQRITLFGGFGIVVDYGHDGERSSLSVRGYKQHEEVGILSEPGRIDITADVDFSQITDAFAQQCVVYGPIAQNKFLSQLGIEFRLKLLKKRADPEQQKYLQDAYNFVMNEMGNRFKTISIFPRTLSKILDIRKGPNGFAGAQLVLLIGDLHIPHRIHDLSPKFRKLLVPNKMQHVLCTGNLCSRDIVDYLRSLSSDIHIVRGDFDDETVKYPDTKVLTVGQFRIGLCHGHQLIPWGDERMLTQLARQLEADVLVTGHTHVGAVKSLNGVLYVNPGSATGAFSVINSDVTPSFALLDVQSDTVVCYLYRLVNDQVKVERTTFKKNKQNPE